MITGRGVSSGSSCELDLDKGRCRCVLARARVARGRSWSKLRTAGIFAAGILERLYISVQYCQTGRSVAFSKVETSAILHLVIRVVRWFCCRGDQMPGVILWNMLWPVFHQMV